jgi:hypothetical protein
MVSMKNKLRMSVIVKGLISFAEDKLAGADRWPVRKMMRPQVELNRK